MDLPSVHRTLLFVQNNEAERKRREAGADVCPFVRDFRRKDLDHNGWNLCGRNPSYEKG